MQQSVEQAERLYTVDEFVVAYEGREGKYELVDGKVIGLSPERVLHAELKGTLAIAFGAAMKAGQSRLRLVIDGPAVRIAPRRGRVPDLMVFDRKPGDARDLVVEEPLLVVEIVSDSSIRTDTTVKLGEYFTVASINDYLIVNPDDRLVTWHRRRIDGTVESSVHSAGPLRLERLGIVLDLTDIWPDDDDPAK